MNFLACKGYWVYHNHVLKNLVPLALQHFYNQLNHYLRKSIISLILPTTNPIPTQTLKVFD